MLPGLVENCSASAGRMSRCAMHYIAFSHSAAPLALRRWLHHWLGHKAFSTAPAGGGHLDGRGVGLFDTPRPDPAVAVAVVPAYPLGRYLMA